MAVFPLLRDPRSYRACVVDLTADADARRYWLDLFASHFPAQLEAAAAAGVPADARTRAAVRLRTELDALAADPGPRLDILELDRRRQRALAAGGIVDEFRAVKARENDAALAALPAHLAAVDAAGGPGRLELIVRGMLAGNLFDLGVPVGADASVGAGIPFASALARVPDRPWRFDGLDAAAAWLDRAPPARAVVFADNAGADVVLGVLPLARELARRGTEVVIAANERPSLNDVTHAELTGLLLRASAVDDALAAAPPTVVSSGNDAPLIDLAEVSGDLADAAAGAGLVVLVGMGRSIESNWDASFTVPCLRVAMVKDLHLAGMLGAGMLDAVCRWDDATAGRSAAKRGKRSF